MRNGELEGVSLIRLEGVDAIALSPWIGQDRRVWRLVRCRFNEGIRSICRREAGVTKAGRYRRQ